MKKVLLCVMIMLLTVCLCSCDKPSPQNQVQEESSAFSEMLKNLDGSQFTCMDGAGNITADCFADALKDAAADGYTLEEGLENGYDPSAAYSWSMEAYFEGDVETTGISWNDLHLRAECYFTENLVKVWYGKAGVYDMAVFENEELYQMLLHKGDREHVIDEDAYKQFEKILTAQIEFNYDGWKDSPGEITGYELLDFHHVGSYEEDDASVELYDFDYALLPEKPEEVMLAGGTSFDSQMRLINFNGGGQFAVRYRNGEMIAYTFMGNDFHYMPGEEEYFEGYEAQQKEWLKSALDAAEKNEYEKN